MLISNGSKTWLIIPDLKIYTPPEFEEKALITYLKSAFEPRVWKFCLMNKIVLPNLVIYFLHKFIRKGNAFALNISHLLFVAIAENERFELRVTGREGLEMI
jgi:hypothetical protein